MENRGGRREARIPRTPVEMLAVRWFGRIPTCLHVFLLIESGGVSQQDRGPCAESSSGPEDRLARRDLRLSHLWLDRYYFPLETTNGLSPVLLPNHSSQHATGTSYVINKGVGGAV